VCEGVRRGKKKRDQELTYDCVSIIGADTDEIGVFLNIVHIFI
jgi:hypothetical protein